MKLALRENAVAIHGNPGRVVQFFSDGENIMSKSQDSKKDVKKQPAKTPKEKKEAKKIKKEAMKRQ